MVLSLESRIKVHQNLDQMPDRFDQSLACERRLDEMEPQVFADGMSLLRSMLQDGIDDLVQQVEQSAPERIEQPDGRDLVPVEKRPRRLVNFFGELRIGGPGYAVREKQKVEYAPVDQRLGLPEGEFSYLFQSWSGRFFVPNAYADTATSLVELLNVKVSVDALESMNLRIAARTNNESERILRDAANGRKTGRTSKNIRRARRRTVLTSALKSLRLSLPTFTLAHVA